MTVLKTFLLSSGVLPMLFATTMAFGDTSVDKAFKICSISGGLDVTRFVSSTTRNFFRSAMEDAELIREAISEGGYNGGIVNGMHDLEQLGQTLDWQARGLHPENTTLDAQLGYVDDRKDRRVERYISLANEPIVGDKQSDMALIESATNLLPWLVDRRSVPSLWWLPHQNGRLLPQDEGASKQAYTAPGY